MKYTNSIYQAHRRPTRGVKVGDLTIGGNHPILVQSMTTTPTTDTDATVAQIVSLVKVGCPLVRVTVPHQADADNLKNIRRVMREKNIDVPLVADIHFLPKLALQSCDYVHKVRVNPGNFADRKRFEVREYSDKEYALEIARVAEEFSPIVRRAKENGVAIRIGTNHGSLSDRIMNRYGDTPQGMVESALEFIRMCRDENFHHIVISMKASNPLIMIQAYRMLVAQMNAQQYDYPLHLGVTEAGDGQDGRVKSSIGISTLLFDGIGDTIRVSLTEDPEREIPVAQKIASLFSKQPLDDLKNDQIWQAFGEQPSYDPFLYRRRDAFALSHGAIEVGGNSLIKVRTPGRTESNFEPPIELVSRPSGSAISVDDSTVFCVERVVAGKPKSGDADAYSVLASDSWVAPHYIEKLISQVGQKPLWIRVEKPQHIPSMIAMIKALLPMQVGIEISHAQIIALGRAVANACKQHDIQAPIHLHVQTSMQESVEDIYLRASCELGALLCDGIGDSIEVGHAHALTSHQVAFGVLQATRLRMSRTDYISCPSCGRTLFDLQETTARIREKTNHLKGVKIAIMGCIVNGPGEMADADFGYVGSGPGKINLFVGKECVKKNIDQVDADQELIDLIKAHGRWCEPART